MRMPLEAARRWLGRPAAQASRAGSLSGRGKSRPGRQQPVHPALCCLETPEQSAQMRCPAREEAQRKGAKHRSRSPCLRALQQGPGLVWVKAQALRGVDVVMLTSLHEPKGALMALCKSACLQAVRQCTEACLRALQQGPWLVWVKAQALGGADTVLLHGTVQLAVAGF